MAEPGRLSQPLGLRTFSWVQLSLGTSIINLKFMDSVFCRSCGAALLPASDYCSKCGIPVDGVSHKQKTITSTRSPRSPQAKRNMSRLAGGWALIGVVLLGGFR